MMLELLLPFKSACKLAIFALYVYFKGTVSIDEKFFKNLGSVRIFFYVAFVKVTEIQLHR
jgi:hypothetical protein